MSSLTSRHDPVAQAPQPALPRRAKKPGLFARLFLVPQMAGWEKALVWLMVLIAAVIAFKMYGLFELGLVR